MKTDMTMSKQIASGKWYYDGLNFVSTYRTAKSTFTDICRIEDGNREPMTAHNHGILIADAGNTYQETGKLPSELKSDLDRIADENIRCFVANSKYISQAKDLAMRLKSLVWRLEFENENSDVVNNEIELAKTLIEKFEIKHTEISLCHADRDGECEWHSCPQLRDKEPERTGRHCPLDKYDDSLE